MSNIKVQYESEDGCEVTVNCKDMGKYTIDDQRYARGYDLWLDKHVSKNPKTGEHLVLSADGKQNYIVNLNGCSCPDYSKGHYCKHAISVDLYEANL